MKPTLKALLPLYSLSLWLAACSSTEPDPLARVSGFCDAWGEEVCTERIVELCAASSTEQCQVTQAESCVDQLSKGSYRGTGAKECLAFINDIYRDSAISREEREALINFGPPCDGLLSGEGRGGDECAENKDCATADGFECIRRLPDEDRHC